MSLPERIEGKVHKQAAGVVGRLLKAQGKKKGGASLKSLTLAPNIVAKKATHAICCETLKCACCSSGHRVYSALLMRVWRGAIGVEIIENLSVIRDIISKTDILSNGQGCRPVADPEKHVISYKVLMPPSKPTCQGPLYPRVEQHHES
eukprot:622223-Prorocentrum_minimum.AAC.2